MAPISKWLSPSEEPAELTEKQSAAMELIKSIKTTPRSSKFPSQNQAYHCWNRYNEWVMCLKSTKGDEEGCKQMRQMALSICPYTWYEKWDEEREEGNFAGIQTEDKH